MSQSLDKILVFPLVLLILEVEYFQYYVLIFPPLVWCSLSKSCGIKIPFLLQIKMFCLMSYWCFTQESPTGHESFCWRNKLATYINGKSCLKPEWKYDLLQAGLMQDQREDKGKGDLKCPSTHQYTLLRDAQETSPFALFMCSCLLYAQLPFSNVSW